MTNYRLGHLLELWTIVLLFFKGYFLLGHNVVTGKGTGAGEIDLIFRHGKTIVFVEVKKRSCKTLAGYAIDGIHQTRTIKASAVWLQKHPKYRSFSVRYDAVLYGHSPWPTHIQNAWQIL